MSEALKTNTSDNLNNSVSENINEETINSEITEESQDEVKKKSKFKRNILISIVAILLVGLIGAFAWASDSYKPQHTAVKSVKSDKNISVVVDENITFTPKNTNPKKGFIFYPGAKVEPMSYAPLCRQIANAGYEVVIVKMPLNFALLSSNKAQEVIDKYNNIDTWVIGGHSLGGVMASKFASEHDNVKGVALFASYPQGDELKNTDKEVISIWGNKDGVLNFESLEESKLNLPKDTQFIELKGGNHAQFGDYGAQKGDNKANISLNEQTDKSAKATIDLLNRVK